MGLRAAVDARGRLLIPVEIRKQLGLKQGDSVLVEAVGPGEFKVVLLKDAVGRARGMYCHLRGPGENISDELIAERRRESEQETGRHG
ncbi:MAG TPA: AbrB/MazE/SpoVT family DNA-binding domain-containing protein [Firmicutes bacterium]|nr:AbrB/MazE/SpoVT family DNA-binding domain-containing protein [Candidatus Fermentithermobacillaceae bacterium]